MKKQNKKTLLCKFLAAVLCFAMMVSAIAPVTAQAASAKALALKYKGKTVNMLDAPYDGGWDEGLHIPNYEEIKKAFGKADKISTLPSEYTEETATLYRYKADGFKFEFIQNDNIKSKTFYLSNVMIRITSAKASLNGIKVGMSYNSVLKKFEKIYGKEHITTQKNKKKISLWVLGEAQKGGMPIEFTFKNGKVSRMYVFYS